MLPSNSFENPLNRWLAHAKAFCDAVHRFSLSTFGANVQNQCWVQLCVVMRFTPRHIFRLKVWAAAISSLLSSVPIVVGISATKEMFRIYARRVVAMMTNFQIIGNQTVLQSPHYAMRFEHLAHFNQTVFLRDASPNPALPKVWHVCRYRPIEVNLIPKALELFRIGLENVYKLGKICRSGLHNYLCELLAVFSATNAANRALLFSFRFKNAMSFL